MLDERMLLVKNGGFSRQDIMQMPIWERRYYVDRLIEMNKKLEEQSKSRK